MGWNAFAMAKDPDFYAGNYEFQVPIFVLTHEVPRKHPKETDQPKFTFVTGGIGGAIRQAKAAAGEKDVVVIGGASAAQQCLRARRTAETNDNVSGRSSRFSLRRLVIRQLLFHGSRVLPQKRVHPRSDFGMVSEQQVPACHQRHELRTGDMLCGVLAEGECVYVVIPGVNN